MRCKLKIKPLSVNESTSESKRKYREKITRKLPKRYELTKGRLFINYDIYLSNEGADLNNFVKHTQDSIFRGLNLEDCNLYEQHERKFICKKGKEKIVFNLYSQKAYRLKKVYLPWLSYLLNIGLISFISFTLLR